MPLRTKQIAEGAGVNLQTVRYYERAGLLPEPPRLPSGYRLFPESSVQRLRFIKRAQKLGFSLGEIRELLSLRLDRRRDRAAVREIALSKLIDIDERIRSLELMRSALQHLITRCSGHGPASNCPILEAIDSVEQLL